MSVRLACLLVLCLTLVNWSKGAVINVEEDDFSVESGKEEGDLEKINGGEKTKFKLWDDPKLISASSVLSSSQSESSSSPEELDASSSSSEENGGHKHKSKVQKRSVENVNKKQSASIRYERSLDSNQDLLNRIADNSNQNSSKTSSEKITDFENVEGEISTTEKEFESSVPPETDGTEVTEIQTDSTSESNSETTTYETTETSNDSETESSEDELAQNTTPSTENIPPKSFTDVAMDRVNKLSDQIRLVLAEYRQQGVVVLPGQSFFPDPMPMKDFRDSFTVGRAYFKNISVFGLSNFTVEHINTDIDRMQVYILLNMKRLLVLGNYSMTSWVGDSSGPFNVTLLGVDAEGVAEIETTPEGHLEAADSEMDMYAREKLINFSGIGSFFQGVISAAGDALFDSIKPQILDRVNLVIRNDINKKLKDLSVKFINKISPVDLAFSEGRKYAREHGYDPLEIEYHQFDIGGLVYINITQFRVEGLSKFYRVGNLSLSMDAGVIEIEVQALTGKLTGDFMWSGKTFGISKFGKTNFTVDHLQVRASVNQSLDLTKKPQLDDLDLELGWVKVNMDSPMTLSIMVEGIINAFPRLIRHIIVDSVEKPLKLKIQEILNKINVESLVDETLPHLDSFGL